MSELKIFPCVEFLDLPGERILLEDGIVDTVVSTFTLCTIPGVVETIRGIGRVLRPGGKLIAQFPKSSSHCWWGTAISRLRQQNLA